MTPPSPGTGSRLSRWAPLLAAVVLVALGIGVLVSVLEVPVPDDAVAPGIAVNSSQSAYNGPHVVPGRVQAEDYDRGGPDVAYSDTTPENIGGAGRMDEAVDVRLVDSVTDIAYIGPGEWTEYTVDVAADGTYAASFRLGAIADGREVLVTVDGAPGCDVDVPNTGSYQVYGTASAPLALRAGTHVLRLTFTTGYTSIDWFEVAGVTSPAGSIPVPDGPSAVTSRPPTDVRSAYAAGTGRLEAMRGAYRAWAIPSRPDLVAAATDVRTAGLANDGATDSTAALQALLDAGVPGATLFFPAGTYRIDGPVGIPGPVTLLGEPGTVFDCHRARSNVFVINRDGSLSSKLGGVTFTGVVIEGPGVETAPTMIDGYYLQDLTVSFVRFHDVGYAAVRLTGCAGAVVEDCVFDTVFMKGYGYGVAILDYSDDITVRESFFVTRGRHGVTTGTATSAHSEDGYTRKVAVENNYFEYMTDQAIDAHIETAGPYIARGNVIVDSRVGVNLRNGIADVSENVFVNCPTAILLRSPEVGAPRTGSEVDRVAGNIIINAEGRGMQIDRPGSVVRDNVVLDANAVDYASSSSTDDAPRPVLVVGKSGGNWTEGFGRITAP